MSSFSIQNQVAMPTRLWLQLFIKNYLLLVAKDCTIDDLNIKQPNESSHFISNNCFFSSNNFPHAS